MSDRPSDRLTPVLAALASISEALRAAADAAETGGLEAAEAVDRVRAITDLLERLITETPEQLIGNNLVATLTQQLQPVTSALPQLATDPATAATALTAATENLLAAVGGWPASPRLGDEAGRRIADLVERRVKAAGRELEGRLAELQGTVASLDEHIEEQRQSFDTTVTAAKEGINARVADAQASLNATKTQADALIPQLQQQFDAAEAARQQAFTESAAQLREAGSTQMQQMKAEATAELTGLKTEISALRETVTAEKARLDTIGSQQQQLFTDAQEQRTKDYAVQRDQVARAAQKQREEQAAQAAEQLSEMQRILEETQRVANAVANTGTATAYGTDAKDERRSADIWRIVAIVLGLSAAVFAAVTLVAHPPDTNGVSIISTTGRFGVTIALGAVATYAARQSGHHRRREERSRQIELELTAFAPFIEGLDDSTKRRLREDYVRRLFRGVADGGPAVEAVGEFQGQQISPIGQVADAISNAVQSH